MAKESDRITDLSAVMKIPEVSTFLHRGMSLFVPNTEKYKSWIGFNYDRQGCTGIKFYFTWYRDLAPDFLKQMLPPQAVEDFLTSYSERHIPSILHSYEYGSGYTLGLKIDAKHRITRAFVYNLPLGEEDYGLLAQRGIHPDSLLSYKGVYHHYSETDAYRKTYYYLNGVEAGKKLIDLFHFSIGKEPFVPVIEYGLGTGFYAESPADDAKIILLGNYEAVWNAYRESGILFGSLQHDAEVLSRRYGLSCMCPAVYANGQIQSFYLCDMADTPHLHTLEKIAERENQLKLNTE